VDDQIIDFEVRPSFKQYGMNESGGPISILNKEEEHIKATSERRTKTRDDFEASTGTA